MLVFPNILAFSPLPQLPVQNELGSFMSNQIPSYYTPYSSVQFLSDSVHHPVVLGLNQSGKTVYPGQTWPMYSVPSGLSMKVF